MKSHIQLRREVYKNDAWEIINWLEDADVTQYLNEGQNVCESIKQVMNRVNMPILTHLFNQDGTFFILSTRDDEPVGFLRLIPKAHGAEIVIVIGDRGKWGKGLGTRAIMQGLRHAFFEWRVEKVTANIHHQNDRSIKAFKRVGFKHEKQLTKEIQFSMTLDEFLKLSA